MDSAINGILLYSTRNENLTFYEPFYPYLSDASFVDTKVDKQTTFFHKREPLSKTLSRRNSESFMKEEKEAGFRTWIISPSTSFFSPQTGIVSPFRVNFQSNPLVRDDPHHSKTLSSRDNNDT